MMALIRVVQRGVRPRSWWGVARRALLGAAQEVFLCNAVIGVWPVRQLGAKRWPLGPVTRRVQAHVAQLLAS